MASREVFATSKIRHIHGDAVTEENEPMVLEIRILLSWKNESYLAKSID